MMQKPGSLRWPIVVAVMVLVLVSLVGAVFLPLLRFDFVDFDVYVQVRDNPTSEVLARRT